MFQIHAKVKQKVVITQTRMVSAQVERDRCTQQVFWRKSQSDVAYIVTKGGGRKEKAARFEYI